MVRLVWLWTRRVDTRFVFFCVCCWTVMKGPAAEFVLSDWPPCCCSASVTSSCLAVNHTTEGFMGKRRALACRAPLYNAADHSGGKWVDHPLTNVICKYAQFLLFTLFFIYIIFASSHFSFFFFTVNIFYYVIIQLDRNWSWHKCKILIVSDFSFFSFFFLFSFFFQIILQQDLVTSYFLSKKMAVQMY